MSRRFVICAIAAVLSSAGPSVVLAEQQACQTLVAASYLAKLAVAEHAVTPDNVSARQLSTEFLQVLAQAAKVSIKLVPAQQEHALAEVHSGRIDLIIGVSPLPEKDSQLEYLSPAYLQKSYGLWVRTGEHRTLKQWPELVGLRGARVVPPQRLIDFDLQAQVLNWPVRTAESLEVAVHKVLDGKADYVVAEEQGMRAYLQEHDLMRRFELMEQAVEMQGLYVAISKDSACNTAALRATLNTALATVVKR